MGSVSPNRCDGLRRWIGGCVGTLFGVVAVCGMPAPVSAAPGDPAPGFGTGGIVSTRAGVGEAPDAPLGAVRQSDGKVVMVSTRPGFFTVGSVDLVRLHPDGRRDNTFGDNGRISVVVRPAFDVSAVAPQGDKILVAGRVSAPPGFSTDIQVMRFLRNGALDPSFSGDGRVTLDTADEEFARSVVAGPGGTVMLGGQSGTDAVVIRLTAAGALDPTYGVAGVRRRATSEADGSAFGSDLHVTTDGAATLVFKDVNTTRVMRLTPTGALDASFGAGGVASIGLLAGPETDQHVTRRGDRTFVVMATGGSYWVAALDALGGLDSDYGGGDGLQLVSLPGTTVVPTDLLVLRNGELVITGIGGEFTDQRWSIVRLTPAGALDPSFSSDGRIDRDLPGNDGAHVIISRPGGFFVIGTRNADLTIMSVDSNGTVATDYGTNGLRSVDASRSPSGLEAAGIDAAPGGRFLVTGMVRAGDDGQVQRFLLMRYRSNGTLDPTFSGDGIVTAHITGRVDRFLGARQLANGRVLAWGSSRGADGSSVVVMRFTASGAIDTTFGNGGRREFPAFEPPGQTVYVQTALDAQGRLVIAHNHVDGGSTGLMVRRLRADGSTDPSFGTSGRRLITGVLALRPTDLRLRNGRPLVLILDEKRLVRLTANGDLDASFGVGGSRPLQLVDSFTAGIITPNGGVIATRHDGSDDTVVARLRPTGQPDATFSDDGQVAFSSVGVALAQFDHIALDSIGRIVLGGFGANEVSAAGFLGARTVIARLTRDGEVDSTFSGDGRALRDAAVGDYEIATGVTVASDDDPVVLVMSASPWLTAHLVRAQS